MLVRFYLTVCSQIIDAQPLSSIRDIHRRCVVFDDCLALLRGLFLLKIKNTVIGTGVLGWLLNIVLVLCSGPLCVYSNEVR